MQIDIPKATDQRHMPGTWQPVLAYTPEPEFKPFWTAIVWCPECGRALNAIGHTIEQNGQINPSLGHPDEYGPCGWHTKPHLLDWTPDQWNLPPQGRLHTCERCGYEAHRIHGWGTWSGGRGIICRSCFITHAAAIGGNDEHG